MSVYAELYYFRKFYYYYCCCCCCCFSIFTRTLLFFIAYSISVFFQVYMCFSIVMARRVLLTYALKTNLKLSFFYFLFFKLFCLLASFPPYMCVYMYFVFPTLFPTLAFERTTGNFKYVTDYVSPLQKKKIIIIIACVSSCNCLHVFT